MKARDLIKQILPPIVVDAVRSRLTRRNSKKGNNDVGQTYIPEFTEFVASKRNFSIAEARRLVDNARGQFPNGWSGSEYRRFTELALETFRPLYDETSQAELIATYKFHGPADFLRMLGYHLPTTDDLQPIIVRLSERKAARILDYGCGLAHRTICVARGLIASGRKVKLFLLDIRKEQHWEFVGFLCRKYRIDHEFIQVTRDTFYPSLPEHDLCDNVSVLEHVPEPLTIINNIDRTLSSRGLLLAAVEDQIHEMMHISPNLKSVRDRLAELHYESLGSCCGIPLFQKGV